MKIGLDACAGDFGAAPNVEGAVLAAERWGIETLLVGPEKTLREALAQRGISDKDARFEVQDAPEVIGMAEEPAAACREKPKASIMAAAQAHAARRTAGLVSVGHSGAAMVASLWHLKRLAGVLRPAIAAPLPTPRGTTLLLDAGANADCKPWHLLQFAVMGSLFAKHVLKVEKPRVGILSIGEEETKGNELVKEAIPLLRCSGLDFRGTVEGRDVPAGVVDVVVCDGFVGNVSVKLIEGTCGMLFGMLKDEIEGGLLSRLGALALRGPFSRLKKRMSYDEYGGAPLLGVAGNVIICHGRSNAKAVANALRVARDLAECGVNDQILAQLNDLKLNLETTKV